MPDPTSETYMKKTRLAAITMAVEIAKLQKKPDMDITAKAKEIYDYIESGTLYLRAKESGGSGK